MKRLTIGELAKRCGVNLETVRYYERRNILLPPPRTVSGYRIYPDSALDRLRFVIQARELGFSLDEIKEFIDLLIDQPSITLEVQKRAEAKIADINEKMRILRRMKKVLLRLINSPCAGDGAATDYPVFESNTPAPGGG